MRWALFDEVPERILDKYYPAKKSGNRQNLRLLHPTGDDPLFFAAQIYWDRNLPKLCSPQFDHEKVMLREGRDGKYYRSRYWEPMGFITNHGAWVPHPDEVQSCCKGLNAPLSRIPWAYKNHCSTIRHIALSRAVNPQELKGYIKEDLGPYYKPHCNHCNRFALKNDIYCREHRWRVDAREQMKSMA